jgi:predicted Zn-dependent protease
LKATGASGQIDAAAEGYRALLRECADAAQPALADLSVLVASHPDHAGLRRALGDAYMRCGRFQKAIEEYNRAVAAQQPVAAA